MQTHIIVFSGVNSLLWYKPHVDRTFQTFFIGRQIQNRSVKGWATIQWSLTVRVPIISDLDQHELSDNICKNVSFYGDGKVCFWISNLAVARADVHTTSHQRRPSHNGSSRSVKTKLTARNSDGNCDTLRRYDQLEYYYMII